MNWFYTINKKAQWLIAGLMILILLAFVALLLVTDDGLLRFLLFFIMVPLYLFLSTPFMTLTKKYNYVSPMLMYIKKDDSTLELHSGTSFDYLFVMMNNRPGIYWKNEMLRHYIDGLSKIIEDIKNEEMAGVLKITGASHFVGGSIIKKIGFEMVEPDPVDRMGFFLGYLDLIWMNSLAKGRLWFPKYSSLKKVEISSSKLVESESQLGEYKEYFKNKIWG